MLPILAAVLAFITIGGLGWVFVGNGDSRGTAVKRARGNQREFLTRIATQLAEALKQANHDCGRAYPTPQCGCEAKRTPSALPPDTTGGSRALSARP